MIIKSINNQLIRMLCGILAVFMVAMIMSVVWQVFTRFVLKDPSSFTDELSRYLLIWIGVLGGAYTYAIKRHLALELIGPKLGRNGQLILSIFINLIIISFSLIVFTYGGYDLVSNTLSNGQISPGIVIFGSHLLIGYVYLAVPLAGAFISYFGIVDIVSSLIKLVSEENDYPVEGDGV